jgi:hypothetical protein
MSACKSAGLSGKARSQFIGLFLGMIVSTVTFIAGPAYFQRGNQGPLLSPEEDYRIEWMTDEEFRALDRADGTRSYTRSNGSTTIADPSGWEVIRPYRVASPDGRWHVTVAARGPMPRLALRAAVGAAVVPVVFALFGLGICLCGRPADSSNRGLD